MLKTLAARLGFVFFVVVLTMGVVFIFTVNHFADTYQQEVGQSLHADLAKNLVKENHYIVNGEINRDALKNAFNTLMVVNPAIEVYLLDKQGNVLAYSAPEGHVVRHSVSLAPISRFLRHDSLPILGDDPRSEGSNIFSAAEIHEDNQLVAYLYVVLHSELAQSMASRLEKSYITQVSAAGLVASLVVALLMGLLLFWLLTKRLRLLNHLMQSYATAPDNRTLRYPVPQTPRDEVDSLGLRFNEMADKIDAALDEVLRNDAKRRELVANVSHDLRTPLATLHGYLETLNLKSQELSTEQRQQYLDIAIKQSEHLSHLINELFELAKLDSCETLLNVEPFSLAELTQDVAQQFVLPAQRKGVEINLDLQSAPYAYGDIALIQRVLQNLIENAIRHTPNGGKIGIALKPESERITVLVSDTGTGIPKESLNNIFERFYRVDKERNASSVHAGLGLAIVKRILTLHGSSIQAMSELHVGTCFSFDLPVYQNSY